MVAAYDVDTGFTAIGKSNSKISVETLDPRTTNYIENKLGVKIGEFTDFCKNKVGACAEVSAADQLVRRGVNPESIRFTDAIRPKEIFDSGGFLTVDAIVPTCPNCARTWPK